MSTNGKLRQRRRATHHDLKDIPDPRDPILTYRQAAKHCGLSYTAMRTLVKKRKIIGMHLSARRVGIRTSEVDKFLNSREIV